MMIDCKGFILSVALLAAAGVCMVGCGGAYKATVPSRPALEDTDLVIYKNMDLKYSVGILDVTEDYVNGLLRVRCRIKNLTGKMINTEIKVKFRDSQGFELGGAAPWTPMPLESAEIRSFEQIASNTDATEFRIIIQRAGSNRSD